LISNTAKIFNYKYPLTNLSTANEETADINKNLLISRLSARFQTEPLRN